MIVDKIAETEKIFPDETEIKKAADRLIERYKDADPTRARAYVSGIFLNEKVFEFLESQDNKNKTI